MCTARGEGLWVPQACNVRLSFAQGVPECYVFLFCSQACDEGLGAPQACDVGLWFPQDVPEGYDFHRLVTKAQACGFHRACERAMHFTGP